MRILLTFALLIFLSGCIEKNLDEEEASQGTGAYCSTRIMTVTQFTSDVSGDFEELDVPNEVVNYENDCATDISVTESYNKISKSGNAIIITNGEVEEEFILAGNQVPLKKQEGNSNNCRLIFQSAGYIDPENNRLVMEYLFEFVGSCN